MTFLIPYMTKNYSKLYEFTVIYSIKHYNVIKIGIVLLISIKEVLPIDFRFFKLNERPNNALSLTCLI